MFSIFISQVFASLIFLNSFIWVYCFSVWPAWKFLSFCKSIQAVQTFLYLCYPGARHGFRFSLNIRWKIFPSTILWLGYLYQLRLLLPFPLCCPLFPLLLSCFDCLSNGCLSPCLLTLSLSRCLSVDSISTGYSHSTETTGLFNRLTYSIAGRASSIRLQPLQCLGSPSQPSE